LPGVIARVGADGFVPASPNTGCAHS
jgi:hypothetical protein